MAGIRQGGAQDHLRPLFSRDALYFGIFKKPGYSLVRKTYKLLIDPVG
jgi:hypothetical protein